MWNGRAAVDTTAFIPGIQISNGYCN
jgi:hypothetical protein